MLAAYLSARQGRAFLRQCSLAVVGVGLGWILIQPQLAGSYDALNGLPSDVGTPAVRAALRAFPPSLTVEPLLNIGDGVFVERPIEGL